jgi:hypothetical protein
MPRLLPTSSNAPADLEPGWVQPAFHRRRFSIVSLTLLGYPFEVTSARSRRGKPWLSGILHPRLYRPLVLSNGFAAISIAIAPGLISCAKIKL